MPARARPPMIATHLLSGGSVEGDGDDHLRRHARP
jgi:hypothetical protein